jgi:hypothetical protein
MSAPLSPHRVAPLFLVVALINAVAVATRFDLVAARLWCGRDFGGRDLVPLVLGVARERE